MMDLRKRCLFILSGVENTLGKSLAVEMCRLFRPGSCAVLIGDSEEPLHEVRKEIEYLQKGIRVVCCDASNWDELFFQRIFDEISNKFPSGFFEMAFMLHNEGFSATHNLTEPQDAGSWMSYVQENLNALVALDQEYLKYIASADMKKLIVNVTSSLLVQPFVYNSLMCSCKKARDMYFRSLASIEGRNGVAIMNYSPGILETHEAVSDSNGNVVDLADFNLDEELLKSPRVQPTVSSLKLVNILQELSFCSGYEVDYYDTYVL